MFLHVHHLISCVIGEQSVKEESNYQKFEKENEKSQKIEKFGNLRELKTLK